MDRQFRKDWEDDMIRLPRSGYKAAAPPPTPRPSFTGCTNSPLPPQSLPHGIGTSAGRSLEYAVPWPLIEPLSQLFVSNLPERVSLPEARDFFDTYEVGFLSTPYSPGD